LNRIKSIRTKLILVYLALAIPLVMLLGFGLYDQYQGQVKIIYEERENLANLTAANVTGFIKGTSTTLDTAGHAIIETDMQPDKINEYLTTIKDTHPTIINVAYLDPQGNITASANTSIIGKNVSSHFYFDQIKKGRSVTVGNYEKHLDGSHGFAIASGIEKDGRLVAVAVALIDTAKLGTILPSLKKGCNNIVDANGTLLFQSEHPDIAQQHRNWGEFEFIKQALAGKTTRTDSFVCPKDKKRHFAVEVPIKEYGWAAGSAVEVDDALAHITSNVFTVGPFYLLLFLAVSGLALFIGSTISNPVIELAKKASNMSETSLDMPIAVESNDEIGVLAKEIDSARSKLLSSFKSMNLLLESSSVLNRSLDLKEVTSTLSETLIEIIGINRVAVASLDETTGEIVILNSNHPLCPHPGERYLISSLPDLFNDLYTKKQAVFINTDDPSLGEDIKSFVVSREIKSMLLYPLRIGGRVIGHITLAESNEHHIFSPQELQMIDSIAAQAAIAIDNARMYEKERDIAEILQQALLNTSPEVPGVKIDHIYEAAMGASKVGGDFYDVFEISCNKVGFVIGDVSGKGIVAATTTSMVKSTVRAFAYSDLDTAQVISKTNDIVSKQIKQHQFATAAFGILDTESGYLEITSAGHPDAVICHGNECLPKVACRNPPLGAFPNIVYEKTEAKLYPGDTIVLYTDGLVEARSDGELFGEERAVETIKQSLNNPSASLLADLIEAARLFTGGNLTDDVAAIALRFRED